ncbi:MAG: ribonuclease inhibitor [Cytophagaceae bacterium]|nr:ribonuclease inhibitor [Cytophagaceae bacterium]|tara:strand:+ start:1226 stop:1612 length:387 start_codon:yes stop_codon:yes gene_type:complete
MRTVEIDGGQILDLATFYYEVERKLTKGLDWRLGHSLDALHDILYGGFGVHAPHEELHIIWLRAKNSQEALGYPETIAHYEQKVQQPGVNTQLFKKRLALAQAHEGRTLFDIIVEILIRHDKVKVTFA